MALNIEQLQNPTRAVTINNEPTITEPPPKNCQKHKPLVDRQTDIKTDRHKDIHKVRHVGSHIDFAARI